MLTACGGGGDDEVAPPSPPPGVTPRWGDAQLLVQTPHAGTNVVVEPFALVADGVGGAWLGGRQVRNDCSNGSTVAESEGGILLWRVDLASGQWSAPVTLLTGKLSGTPTLVAGQGGNMLLAYIGVPLAGAPVESVARIFWCKFDAGTGRWTEQSVAPGDVDSGSVLALRAGSGSDAVLAVSAGASPYSMRFNGATAQWRNVVPLGAGHPLPTQVDDQHFAVDARGNAYWLAGSVPFTIWTNSPGTDAWVATDLPLSQANGRLVHAGTGSLGLDGAGNALVAWLEYDSASGVGGQLIEARRPAGGTAWSVQSVPLAQFQEPRALSLRLTMDAAGNAWLTGNTDNALYRRPVATGTWQRLTLTPDIAPAGAQIDQLVLDAQGNAVLAGALPGSINAQVRPSAWWNRFDAASGQWQGPAQFVVSAAPVDDPAYAALARTVRVNLAAAGAGQSAMVITEAVPVTAFRCFGSASVRLWGTTLR